VKEGAAIREPLTVGRAGPIRFAGNGLPPGRGIGRPPVANHFWRKRVTDRNDLADLLRERSVREGDFVLASGARSTFYIDARPTTMAGRGQALIGRLGLAEIEAAGWAPAAVGGLTLGADPVAYAIAHTAALQGKTLDAFTVRKQAKDHGAGRQIEGNLAPASDVVVIEDTVTSGGSALRAIEVLEAAGARVLGVLAIVDREEGARDRLEAGGYALRSLFTAGQLLGRQAPAP
jgi:orotate phosphoribosyltransferase